MILINFVRKLCDMNSYFKYLPEEIFNKKIDKRVFPFSQYLFWDYPIESVDIEKHKYFIIERVLSRGLLQDFYMLLQLYSKKEISEAIKKSKVFDDKLRNFCSHYFEIPLNEINASSFYC